MNMHSLPVAPLDAQADISRQYGALSWRLCRNGALRILLVTSRRTRRWIIPKGWPMDDRAPFMTASLEAFEEAGVIGDVSTQPLTHFDYDKVDKDGGLIPCRVDVFDLKVQGTLTHWKERKQRSRRWFSPQEAAEKLSDPGLAAFVHGLTVADGLLAAA